MISSTLLIFDSDGTLLYTEGSIISAGMGNAIDWVERTGLAKRMSQGSLENSCSVSDAGRIFQVTFKTNANNQIAVLVQLSR